MIGEIMKNTVIYLLVLFAYSANGRVANNESSLDISSNIISDIKITEPIVGILPELTTETSNQGTETNDVIAEDTESITPLSLNNITENEITNNDIDSGEKHTTSNENELCINPPKIDNEGALILTPFIQSNCIKEARRASKVDRSLFLGFKSYTGFLTVNETYNSNIFFWYFPNQKLPVSETPLILWLQGGPGATSMTGLFDEIGPFHATADGNLIPNPHTWLKDHSLLFIDNPVGTGYSFTNDVNGYAQDMDTYGDHLYTALKQFLQIFPELRAAPLFVSGESYAGKYVPALAIRIHRHRSEEPINLKGLMVGNGYTDPAILPYMASPFLYFGLLEVEQVDLVKPVLDAFQKDLAANDSVGAKLRWNRLIVILLILTKQNHAYNFLRDDLPISRYVAFLGRDEVKKALHVGDLNVKFVNTTVNAMLNPDFLSSARPLYEELLEHYRVMHYCGQLDQMMSCVLSSQVYRTWKWSGSGEFRAATRHPYMFKSRVAGYHKTGGRLTEVVVRGAGHMVPLDAPAPAQHLAATWTRADPLGESALLADGTFLNQEQTIGLPLQLNNPVNPPVASDLINPNPVAADLSNNRPDVVASENRSNLNNVNVGLNNAVPVVANENENQDTGLGGGLKERLRNDSEDVDDQIQSFASEVLDSIMAAYRRLKEGE